MYVEARLDQQCCKGLGGEFVGFFEQKTEMRLNIRCVVIVTWKAKNREVNV
jgi:hypothetical protein